MCQILSLEFALNFFCFDLELTLFMETIRSLYEAATATAIC